MCIRDRGGSLPDVFWMHSNESQRYMSNDMLLDLTDKIKDSDKIDPENYPSDIWGLYTYEDKYYAVPKDVDTIVLWYNKAMFDEAGLEYPTSEWTWDDAVSYTHLGGSTEESKGDSGKDSAGSGEEITLKVFDAHAYGLDEYAEMAKKFEESHPGVKIEVQHAANDSNTPVSYTHLPGGSAGCHQVPFPR